MEKMIHYLIFSVDVLIKISEVLIHTLKMKETKSRSVSV